MSPSLLAHQPTACLRTGAAPTPTGTLRRAGLTVLARPECAGQLRRHTLAQLDRWKLGQDEPTRFVLELAASELATNGFLHGSGRAGAVLTVVWILSSGGAGPDWVSISVLNEGSRRVGDSGERAKEDLSEGQRGLVLSSARSDFG
jgi:hypothetical protein